MIFNRREMLGATAFLAASAIPTSRPFAATGTAAETLGITSLSDGSLSFPLSFYLLNIPAEESRSLLQANGLSPDSVTPDCNLTLFRDGDRVILFDAGAGSRFLDSVGLLPETLENAGIDPQDVTDIVFTHAHPDHLWGVLDDFDEPLFSNATHHISKAEWDFWIADDTIDGMPDAQKSFAAGAKRNLEAIEDRVERFEFETEVLPGVFAVDTSGHTPGHTSFEIRRDGQGFVVIGDAIAHPVISFQKPGWSLGTDQDPEKAITVRKSLLQRLADEKIGCLGYHLVKPGTGFVERHAGAFRFVPS